MQTIIQSNRAGYVQLEIPDYKLEELFNTGLLCAAEIHCLNATSKDIIKNICKNSCAKRMHCFNLNQQSCFLKPNSARVDQVIINK